MITEEQKAQIKSAADKIFEEERSALAGSCARQIARFAELLGIQVKDVQVKVTQQYEWEVIEKD